MPTPQAAGRSSESFQSYAFAFRKYTFPRSNPFEMKVEPNKQRSRVDTKAATGSASQARQFDLVKTILWKIPGQISQKLFRRIPILIAKAGNDQQQTRV